MKKEKKDGLEDIYYCFRYSFSCKSCPKSRECEEKAKKEEKKKWKKESYIAGLVEKKNLAK